jgi:uroporphyrinogen III methyltransferase / synthase
MKSEEERRITTAEPQKRGYVYIIGAGPGDPELLTIKGERVLREADVILYDDLVSSELVAQFDALKIYTGKRKDSHHFEQDAINAEIIHHALQGKIVARLKGGDPFIFGRGGEEIDVLRQYGISYEIIPGITAAHGASAYTEIPLTMRKVSSSVVFCTGHPVNKIQVPDADTLVYYMVASTVHDVLDAVVAKGRSEDTMVAVIENATRYNQKIVTGTLGELRKSDKVVYSPALLIVGDTIKQYIKENWYSKKKKVLIMGGDSGMYDREDYIVVYFPCKRVDGADHTMVMQCLESIEQYSVLLFSCKSAVKYFFTYLTEFHRDARYLARCRIYALGKAVSAELHKYGVVADFCFEPECSGDMLALFKAHGVEQEEILLPASELPDEYLVTTLETLHNRVTSLSVFRHLTPVQDEPLDLDFIDEVYFSSQACIRNFKAHYNSLPERISVKTADHEIYAEYRKLFCA